MRVGQNPAKLIDHVPQPRRVTAAVVSYIPFLSGYYAQSLPVLQACLDSLWETRCDSAVACNADILVFDNASDPKVRAYLVDQQMQGRIQYLVLADKNVGKGGAWNFIFQAAPGEIIAYADSDVLFRPGWLAHTLQILETYPRAGMVTARPLRTPEEFYTGTLAWARQEPQANLEQAPFLDWQTYREHVLSLGTEEALARQWYDSRQDYRLGYQGIQAYIGAAHFQFTARKDVLAEFLPFQMDRPMGQVRSLDEKMNAAGYLRLATCKPLVRHMGNRLPEDILPAGSIKPAVGASRLSLRRLLRRPLLWLYDRIFDLYHT